MLCLYKIGINTDITEQNEKKKNLTHNSIIYFCFRIVFSLLLNYVYMNVKNAKCLREDVIISMKKENVKSYDLEIDMA